MNRSPSLQTAVSTNIPVAYKINADDFKYMSYQGRTNTSNLFCWFYLFVIFYFICNNTLSTEQLGRATSKITYIRFGPY